jgi:hypothetical protein
VLKLALCAAKEAEAEVKTEAVVSKLEILADTLPEYTLKEDVKTKEVESKPSKNSAVVAYEAEVTDPVMLPFMVPVTLKLPVICTLPI